MEVRENESFRGQVSKSFQFIGVEGEGLERSYDPKIPETRLTVLGNQYVVLRIFGHQHVGWLIPLIYLPE